jgi:subtilase family serine protease
LKASRIPALICAFVVLLAAAGSGSAATPGLGSWAGSVRATTVTRVCTLPFLAWANCGAQVVSDANGTPLAAAAPPAGAITPAQFHSAYNLPLTAPNAATIAIVDAYDDPSIESDLATYDTYFNLPACTTANGCFSKVNQNGGTVYPAKDAGWALEISLDVETAHAVCQNCKILLVEASSASITDLGRAENTAAALGANVISDSWGSREYGSELNDESLYFHHAGVPIVVSTGDNGFGVEFPASSRYVTAVGGTTLSLGAGGNYLGETAWSGAGSGCSAYIPKPAWQTDTGCARRSVADVSADADPNTGAAIYDSVSYNFQSGWFQVGGTSLSTPLIAAAYALAGNTSGVQDASGLYAHAGSLRDITSGSNGHCSPPYLCTAGVGYDGPTGLGTPLGVAAFGGGSAPAQDFSLGASPGSQTVAAGNGTTYSVNVTRLGGFSGSIGLSATGLPAGVTAAFAPSTIDSGSTSSTLTLNTSSSVAGGGYSVTVTGTSGSLTHSTTVSLTVQGAPVPDFSLGVNPSSRTVTAGGSGVYTVGLNVTNGFSGAVALSTSGLPAGATPSFSPASVTPGAASSTLTVTTGTLLAGGTYPFTITGTSGSLVHSVSATLVVQQSASADFSISVSPSSATVPSTGTTTFTVTITPLGGFSGQVTLSSDASFRGMSLSFSPNPTSSTATLTLTTAGVGHSRAPTRITITGTSGSHSHSTTLSISV